MIPSRWPRALWWLLFIPGFVVLSTGFLLLRGGTEGLPLAAVISLAIAVPLDAYILALRWRADARFDAVKELWPHGYLVEGLKCDPTTAALFSVGGATASASIRGGFVAAFDSDGVRFYAGARRAAEFLRVRWSDVEAIDTATVTVPNNRQATALTLTVAHDNESTVLPIVIKATRGMSGFRYSSGAETLAHLKAIRSLRGALPEAPHNATHTEAPRTQARTEPPSIDETLNRRDLAPGISSVGMARAALVAFAVGALAFLAMLPFGILTWTHIWAVPTAIFLPLLYVGLGGITVGRGVALFIPQRESAEVRAGYTLSSQGDINVDQLDPKTGYVIRPAGHPALSREQERREKTRARTLAGDVGNRTPVRKHRV
jgi:hypothetical protein